MHYCRDLPLEAVLRLSEAALQLSEAALRLSEAGVGKAQRSRRGKALKTYALNRHAEHDLG